MKIIRWLCLVVVTLAVCTSSAVAQAGAAPAQPPAGAQQAAPPVDATQQLPAPGAAPLHVMVGKSLLVRTADRMKRVSVTDSAVADAVVVTPNDVLIHGRSPGEVSLVIWDEQDRARSFDLVVEVDLTTAAREIHRIFPEQQINVSPSRSAIVLSGHVTTKEVAERAGAVAGGFTKNVINVLTWGAVGAQEVLLEVKFAEVNRTALSQFGFNIFSTGAANTFGATSTQQFSPFAGSNVGAVTGDVRPPTNVPGSHLSTSVIGNSNFHQPGVFGTNDLLNIFLFRTDINLGTIIKAMQQKNLLQILAEPNLIAVNGKEASFLAGGEFPFPVIQGAGALGSVTIQFKEFGVRLRFTPLIQPNGNIYLQVRPEVSSLDFANALTISGFVVPALSTRRAETEFELLDGQSFLIAGLIDNRVTNVANKVPGLGDLPIIGNFFKSKSLQKTNSELMVLVTARRISPSAQPSTLPKFPEPFMTPSKGDGSKGVGGK